MARFRKHTSSRTVADVGYMINFGYGQEGDRNRLLRQRGFEWIQKARIFTENGLSFQNMANYSP